MFARRIFEAMFGAVFCATVGPAAHCAELYIGPPGRAEVAEMFHSPDGWQELRKYVTGVILADHSLNQIDDAELTLWFRRMNEWHINLELEVGAIKPWSVKGDETYQKDVGSWQRAEHLGGHISSIAMDGPLAETLKRGLPEQYAVDETVKFIALVREHYPGVRIGDIEPFPSLPVQTHLGWLDALQGALARKGIRGLDFCRLDVNWVVFVTEDKGNWRGVKQIEDGCHDRKISFSLIYWASDYPPLKARGFADNETWYTSIMAQGYSYAAVGGKPDQYVVESWIGAPTVALPEEDRSSFAGSVLQFARRFVK